MSGVGGLRVGLDIGATKTQGVVIDGDRRLLADVRRPTRPGAEAVVDGAARVLEQLYATVPDAAGRPVGIGLPGLVDHGDGRVKHAVNLGLNGDWVPVGPLLSTRLRVPVAVENDVNAATLGAVALTGEQDLAYLSIGTGLAAGLVLDGRLRRGRHGAAGEIGHVPVDATGRRCQCGQVGCLETVASGAALSAAWPPGEEPSARAVFAAADAGDPAAARVVERFVSGVAAAVRVLALAVDPHAVVLGGGVATSLGDRLGTEVAAVLERQAAESPFLAALELADRLRVVPPEHPVAALGAALLT